MTQTLTGGGYVSYNGVTLQGPTVNTSFSLRPIRDDANRTVIANHYTLKVTAIATDDPLGLNGTGGSADTNIQNIRAAFTKDGGALVVSGQGLGAFEVNTTASNRDLKFGPRTVTIDCQQIGSTSAIEVVWIVEFEIAECSAGTQVGILGNLKSVNYSVSYSIGKSGLTNRTISGYVEIILNRTTAQGALIPYTADDVRHIINPAVPENFQRVNQSYLLSPDKSRISFNIDDEELPSDNGFPIGVSNISVRHSVKSNRGLGFSRLTNVISGSIEMVKTYPTMLGIERALMIIREKVLYARAQNDNGVLLHSVEFSESMFTRSIDFSVTYEILKSGLQQIFTDSGICKPLQSTNYGDWAATMKNLAWHERGISQLYHSATQDRIVDPCNPVEGKGPDSSSTYGILETGIYKVTNVCPPKSRSYLAFKNSISVESGQSNVIEHKEMAVSGSSTPATDSVTLDDEAKFLTPPSDHPHTTVVQSTKEAEVYIVLRGSAVRLCYPSQFPDLKAIGGWNTPSGSLNNPGTFPKFYYLADQSHTTHAMTGYVGGLKTYSGTWELRYKVTNATEQDIKDLIANVEKFSFGTVDDPSGEKAKEAPGVGFGP